MSGTYWMGFGRLAGFMRGEHGVAQPTTVFLLKYKNPPEVYQRTVQMKSQRDSMKPLREDKVRWLTEAERRAPAEASPVVRALNESEWSWRSCPCHTCRPVEGGLLVLTTTAEDCADGVWVKTA